MPLIIDGQRVESALTIDKFVYQFPQFKERSSELLHQETTSVEAHYLLYIGQREIGATSPNDEVISILGSEDATTCHIAVLRHTGSGASAMVHFDGIAIPEGLETMVRLVTDLTDEAQQGRLEFHLVGGFLDDRRNSHEVSDKVLCALHKSKHEFHLVTACITDLNTEYKKSVAFPVIYGVAFDVKTGILYKATFPDHGPDSDLRGARVFTGGKQNITIYNAHTHEIEIGPFHYDPISNVELFLTFPDREIRKYLSTSPEQEPEWFAAHTRRSLTQIRDFPNPLRTVFMDKKPRRYVKDKSSGLWNRVP